MSDVKIKENSDVAMLLPFSLAIIHYPTVSGFNMEFKHHICFFICYSDQPLNSDTELYTPRLQNKLDSDNAYSHYSECITVLGNVNINIWKLSVVL
jgi:hypothetical protein